jgi:hypothetical protein
MVVGSIHTFFNVISGGLQGELQQLEVVLALVIVLRGHALPLITRRPSGTHPTSVLRDEIHINKGGWLT